MTSLELGKGKVWGAAILSLLVWHDSSQVNAQTDAAAIPDLSGLWDGGGRARPVNSADVPWTAENFPVLNERALAYQQVFEEIIAPKYDCQDRKSVV